MLCTFFIIMLHIVLVSSFYRLENRNSENKELSCSWNINRWIQTQVKPHVFPPLYNDKFPHWLNVIRAIQYKTVKRAYFLKSENLDQFLILVDFNVNLNSFSELKFTGAIPQWHLPSPPQRGQGHLDLVSIITLLSL